ncbi:MAG: hypothetical protein HQM10_07610 [Candidatus Riflebacteria bacterium]|nr:hypothetical protein [Candidatus Riflebacteria bacterium]
MNSINSTPSQNTAAVKQMHNHKQRYIFGEWKDSSVNLSTEDVIEICNKAEEMRYKISEYPADKLFSLIDRLGTLWSNKEYHGRKKLLEILPGITGFSYQMIEQGLEQLQYLFNSELLQKKLTTEMRNIPRAGELKYNSHTGTALSWHPLGTILHICSGNVFLAGAGSLIEGLITGNVNILKMPSEEKTFLPVLLDSLCEVDSDKVISNSICVIDYSSSQSDVISEFKKRVDGIVVWGGENAVKSYRENLSARTRLILFGPKISLAVITESALKKVPEEYNSQCHAKAAPNVSQSDVTGKENICRSSDEYQHSYAFHAEKLAEEISIWDQNACTAPQICFVQKTANAEKIAAELAIALEKREKTLPAGTLPIENAVEIRKLRDVFEIASFKKCGGLHESKENLAWTVLLDFDKTIEPSPLHRTIRVVPFESVDEIISGVESLRGYVQTAGISCAFDERIPLTAKFAASGAVRITDIGQMAGGEIDDPHDGAYDLSQYVNIAVTRSKSWSEDFEPIDFMTSSDRKKILDSRLRILIEKASKSEFYRTRFAGLIIDSVDDLEKIPVLTRSDMESNLPPGGTGLLTGEITGGYVSRSGGSTGEPKFSIYDGHDWEQMISNAVRLFRATGIRPKDRLANCFLSGDLYGSFVSFDHINVRMGVTNFAFGRNVKPEVFLKVWKTFKLNAIQGVPSLIMPFLRALKTIEPGFFLEKYLYAGEPLSSVDREWLVKELKIKNIASIIGANDGGQIAFQCGHLTGRKHHVNDDFNFIEIVDESGKRVPDGESGRILITSLLKYAAPLIRYEIGDLGRIIPEKCSCGRTQRIIEYLGRADDVLCIGLMNIKLSDISRSVEKYDASAVQVAGSSSTEGDIVTVRIEIESSSGSELSVESLSEKIRNTILEDCPVIIDRLTSKTLARLEVKIFKPGELSRNPRTGKLKGIIDERC